MGWLVAAMIFLRRIWKPERIPSTIPERASDGFRTPPDTRQEVRMGTAPRSSGLPSRHRDVAVVSLDGWGRYVWAVVVIVAAVWFLVAR